MKISVVMAVYNGAEYIKEQLDSICNQSYKPDEVLIFDDGSQDNTYMIIKDYISLNMLDNWHLIKNECNKGWKKNFIDAINQAAGELIFLADQDDIWLDNKIEEMVKVMEENIKCNVLACNFTPFYDGIGADKALTAHQLAPYGEAKLEKVKFDKWWMEPWRPGCCLCLRNSVKYDLNKIWFDTCAHDLAIWALGIAKGEAYILNKVLHKQRRHPSTSTPSNKKTKKNRSGLLEIYYKLADNIEKQISNVQSDKELKEFYYDRLSMIRGKNYIKAIKLLFKLSLYPSPKSYLADIYSMFN